MEFGWMDGIWMKFGWNLDEMPDEPCSALDGMLDGIHGNVLHFGVRCFKKNMIIVIVRIITHVCRDPSRNIEK